MKLIGAGLPRTATLSQKVALEILGLGQCYHMVDVLGNLDLVPLWRRALEGHEPWPEIFDGYQATVDWPGAFFHKELIDVYPESKVLLSVRNAGEWERSVRNTIWATLRGDSLISYLSGARAQIDPKWRAFSALMEEMWKRSGLMPIGGAADDGAMGRAMERYNEEVKRAVPADRLLVWTASDGWEPLTEFLNVPVPPMPFPHLNDTKEFVSRVIDGSLAGLQTWWAGEQMASGNTAAAQSA